MKKIGKTETRNLLRHATSASSTKEVAGLLSVAESRISEGKSGNWQISQEQAKILQENYGRPMKESGLFEHAEIWPCVDDFIGRFISTCEWNHYQRILKFTLNSDLKFMVDNLIRLRDGGGGDKKKDFFSVISNKSFQDSWAALKEKYPMYQKKSYSMNRKFIDTDDILNILHEYGADLDDSWGVYHAYDKKYWLDFLCSLYVLNQKINPCEVKFEKLEDFFSNQYSIDDISKESLAYKDKGVVLTGDNVWSYTINLGNEFNEKLNRLIILPDSINGLSLQFPLSSDVELISSDEFSLVEISVFITNKLNYYILMKFKSRSYRVSPDRSIVVKNLSSDEIFLEIGKIFDFLCSENIPLEEIKKNVARQGGYISGAMYLE